jgi:hypothetical protein
LTVTHRAGDYRGAAPYTLNHEMPIFSGKNLPVYLHDGTSVSEMRDIPFASGEKFEEFEQHRSQSFA